MASLCMLQQDVINMCILMYVASLAYPVIVLCEDGEKSLNSGNLDFFASKSTDSGEHYNCW